MRTLKRTLSLVLALVMCLGLFGVASAASYPDADKVQYTEAVNVMTGIGAINGMGDGSFNPTGSVTRAQAAKMVAYAILGEKIASSLPVSASSFKDVDANYAWASPSIEYLVKLGVINGRGNGNFDPEGKVTAYEIAKMLLCSVGYGKNGEYTGNGWELTVAIAAQKAGVFTGSKATNLNAAATREETALYCYNVMSNVESVVYNKNTNSYDKQGVDSTIAKTVYKMATDTAMVESKGMNVATKAINTKIGANTYVYDVEYALFGHNVKVFYNSVANADGTYNLYSAIDLSTTYTVPATVNTVAALNKALGYTPTLVDAANVPTFTNYAKTTADYNAGADTALADADVVALAGKTLVLTNKVITAVVNPTVHTLDKVAAISTTAGSESITLSGAGVLANNKTSDVVNEYAGIAKDDIVAVTVVNGVSTLEKVKTVEGTVSKKNGTTYTLGGVDYKRSTATNNTGLAIADPSFTGTYTLYLDLNGNYFACVAKTAAPTSSLTYLVDVYSTTETVTDNFGVPTTTTKYWAQCVNMSGEQVIYQLSKAEFDKVPGTNAKATLYNVATAEAVDADNSNLKAVYATFSASSSKEVTTAVAANAVKMDTNDYFASNVKFIYVSGAKSTLKVTVKDGVHAIADTINKEYVATAVAGTSNNTVSYVIVENAYTTPDVAGTAVMFGTESAVSTTQVPYTDATGAVKTGYLHTVYIDGVKTEIITAANTAISGFNKYTVAGNLYTITGANAASNLKAPTAVTNMFNGMISTADVTDMTVAGAKVVNTTTNTKVPTDATALTTADTVALVLNATGTAVVMVYVTATTR